MVIGTYVGCVRDCVTCTAKNVLTSILTFGRRICREILNIYVQLFSYKYYEISRRGMFTSCSCQITIDWWDDDCSSRHIELDICEMDRRSLFSACKNAKNIIVKTTICAKPKSLSRSLSLYLYQIVLKGCPHWIWVFTLNIVGCIPQK